MDKLYNVEIESNYHMYDCDIDVTTSKLVIANNKDEAVNYAKKDLCTDSNSICTEKIIDVYEVKFDKVKRKRKTGYYIK